MRTQTCSLGWTNESRPRKTVPFVTNVELAAEGSQNSWSAEEEVASQPEAHDTILDRKKAPIQL